MKINHRNLYWVNVDSKTGKINLAPRISSYNKLALLGKDNNKVFVVSEKKEYEVDKELINEIKSNKQKYKLINGGYYNYPSLMQEYNHARVHDKADKILDNVAKKNGNIKASQINKLEKINNKVAKYLVDLDKQVEYNL